MNEFLGLAYYAEVPAVIFDVQRTGPSTGMPTRTQQGDLMMCAYASHGDTRHICLYPSDPREAFEFAAQSFDLAERFQTPVFVLSDLDIGMNDWMIPRLTWDDSYRPDRGKVLSRGAARRGQDVPSLRRSGRRRHRRIARCPDVHPAGAYFTRGSGHNRFGAYTEDGDEYAEVVDRIDRKIQRAARAVPAPVTRMVPGARIGLLTVGGCHAACVEALDLFCRGGNGIDYMRVRGFPFGDEVRRFLESHETNFIVEQNRDAQLRSLLMLETGVPIEKLQSIRYYAGFPMSARARRHRTEGQAGARGMTYIAKPKVHHPALPEERDRPDPARLRGRDHDALRRVRPRLDHRGDHPGVLGSVDPAAPRREAVGHRLLVEDAGLLPARGARVQRRARPDADAGDRAPTPPTATSSTSASRATATRCRSASGTCATPSGATSTSSTCSRTTASTG